MNANGQVYLVNPNGIAITRSGAVKVGGGFVASTLAISNDDFNAGNLNFIGNGASASVSNAGAIAAGAGGFVGLIGGAASNSGTISVPLGKVALGSGERATLDLSGDGFLQVAAPTNATTANGQALVDVSGKISAAGGRVQLKAATVATAIRDAVNVSGFVSASSAHASGGSIVLGGGPGGNVRVTGSVVASGRRAGGKVRISGHDVALSNAVVAAKSRRGRGGTVKVAATDAATLDASTIDVSGARGGGTIRIGGANARSVSVDAAATIVANATMSGNGGEITILSDGATGAHGILTAEGGPRGGDGGKIETSGQSVDLAGLSVDASAAHGKAGTWLLDPTDLVIDDALAAQIDAILNTGASGTNVVLQTSASGAPVAPVALTSGETNPSGNGDIIDNATVTPLAWSTSATLTLSAYNSIAINAPIIISGAGGLVLTTNNNVGGASSGGGAYSFAPGQSVSFTGVYSSANDGGNSALDGTAQGALTINGTAFTLINSVTQIDAIDGVSALDGSTIAQYGPGLGGAYALANNLTATATYTSALVGSAATPFSGALEGLGHTISNLTIAAPNAADVGLVGDSTGIVRDIGLVGGSVTAGQVSGDLVGVNNGTVDNAYATGAISGGYIIGGLVGESYGAIANAYATGPMIGTLAGASGGGYVAGLVGVNYGTIVNAYASGSVSGPGYTNAGLVGYNGGAITQAYATGAVSSGGDAGGFVGANYGTIAQAYATGAVSSTGYFVGGFAGLNENTITNAYATGAVSAFVTGTDPLSGGDAGGFVGENDATIANAYSTGAVSVGAGALYPIGGFAGKNFGTITNAYFDILTSGLASDGLQGAAIGLTTAQLQGATIVSLGAAFSGGAAGGQGGVYPYLSSFFPNGVQAISGVACADRGTTPLASPSGIVATPVPAADVVSILADGAAFGSATTGANGYYYVFGPAGAIPSTPGQILATETGSLNGAPVAGATLAENAVVTPTLSGLDIYGNYLKLQTSPDETSLAATIANLNSAIGNSAQPASAAALTSLSSLQNLEVDASGPNFAFDAALAGVPFGGAMNTLVVNSAGRVTQSRAFTTSNLLLLGSGAGFALTDSANQVETLAAAAPDGAISLTTLGTLTIGDVGGVNGVNASGGSVGLTADAIAQGPADAAIDANILTAKATNGIGAAGFPLQTAVANLALSNVLHGIYVANAGDVTLAATNGGDIEVATTGNLTVGPVGAMTGVATSADGDIFLRASGNFALGGVVASSGVGSNALTIVVGGAFANYAGAGALLAPNGRWLVYLLDPQLNSSGGLGANFAQFDTFAGGLALEAGDGFIYAAPEAPFVANPGSFASYAQLDLDYVALAPPLGLANCDATAISVALARSGHVALSGPGASCGPPQSHGKALKSPSL